MAKGHKLGAVLLGAEHFRQQNRWGHPIVGWHPSSQGVGGIVNHRGFGLLRVVLTDEEGALYDQPIIVEAPGAIVIATINGKIGMVQNFRRTGERLFEAGGNYVELLDTQERWQDLVTTLGEMNWESPRGMLPKEHELNEGETAVQFAVRTAGIEASEEAGFKLVNPRVVGQINTNTTFFPHAQSVVYAKIESIHEATPENLETFGKMKLMSPEELRVLATNGEFTDGPTMAALALCGIAW